MKNIFSIQKNRALVILLGLLVCSFAFISCDDDNDSEKGPITISKVYLEDADATIKDREVEFARLGQVIRIEGSGFSGLRKVYINGFSTYFNPVYVSDNSMLISISKNTPIIDAEQDVRNTIRFVKSGGAEAILNFSIRSAAPSISRISHTMPNVGETITIYGAGLTEINKIVFPGNVEVTSGIISDPEGEFCTVEMPAGVSEDGGSLLVEGANGGVYSPAYFNFKKGVILDFDGRGSQGSWGSSASMIKADDLESASIGIGTLSQGKYVAHKPARIDTFPPAKNRCTEVWTAGNGVDNWRGQLTSYIAAITPVNQVAFQFDIYVPEAWSGSGFLKICLENAFNGGEWAGNAYNYVPWIVGNEIVPFQTEGWTTVTIPFSQFYKFSEGALTFEAILAAREAASYANFGIYFENSDIKLSDVTGMASEVEFPSATSRVKVYTDNWRVVSLATPAYSDFPEAE